MAIKINDIPPEGLTLELAQKLDLFDHGTATTAFTAVLNIKPMGGGNLHISGRIQSAPVLECSRCLASFTLAIDSELDIDLAPVSAMGADAEHELGSGELDMEFYKGDEIEPVEIIKEQLLISIPMVPLHSPECKGLCSVCGTDLNKTECGHQRNAPGDFGAFSALRDLLKK
ncbi:MAG: YceD family protein [Betaproteobacteria bacterium]